MSDQPPAHRPASDVEMVCGVDRRLVERFLYLVRDNYEKSDRSSFFLEEVCGTTHTVVMANLRDVLSHLATMLAEDTPPEQWEAQIVSAEEHFRRAIQEPYAIALGHLRERFNTVYARYQSILPEILTLQKEGLFDGALTDDVIQVRLRNISELSSQGRGAKRRNRIDPEWDAGVASYTEAFDALEKLTQTISAYNHQYESMSEARESVRQGRSGVRWSRAGLIGTVVFGILSFLLVLFPSLANRLRNWFGMGN